MPKGQMTCHMATLSESLIDFSQIPKKYKRAKGS